MHVGMQTGIIVTSATLASKKCHVHVILLYMRWGAGLQKLFDKAPETLNSKTQNSELLYNLKPETQDP